ncbi:tyrosine-type recombinase/integrase [Chitinophaga sp. GCM10012297]|uniref:Tyrosine-type recombinase/integrase n=1 Tax=Chitinophaga chungangae TaxID=2821488 RepID=A0ABS3YHG7_9BACT|nr:tyrosine-type recombinase/integrase [Chitinophaga chungangae]MBO9154084.1 tyrosine-type recombinase/integrase [Chitinophaga chungangae]
MRLPSALQTYLQHHYTSATVASYGRQIAAYLGSCPASATAGYTEVLAYIGMLRQRYGNAYTLARELAAIKVYYDWLCDSGQRDDHPARIIGLKDPRSRDVQLQDLLSPAELQRLLHQQSRYGALYYRNAVLMGLLVHQGLRVSEMAGLRANDINLDAGTIYIASTAQTNARTLSLQPDQVLLFYSYLHGVRPKLLKGNACDALLIGLRGNPMPAEDIVKHVQRYCKPIFKDKKVSAGVIHQSVIANLLKAGHDLLIVQAFAGHKYPSSTERYRGGDTMNLQAAIDQYYPL